MSYKVVVVDYPWEESLKPEKEVFQGIDVDIVGNKTPLGRLPTNDEIVEMASNADGIIHFDSEFPAEVIEKLDNCKVIVRQAVGYDNINLDAARKKGIYVANCPEYCTQEVATHTCALLLGSWQQLKVQDGFVHKGYWKLPDEILNNSISRLSSATLGFIGFGRIARTVAKYMAPFGLTLIGFDPYVSDEVAETYSVGLTTLEKVFERSDLISCHAPLTDETEGMVGGDLLRRVKEGLVLVNTSRAEVIDKHALLKALHTGAIASAGFDVWYDEPILDGEKILEFNNVYLTPHSSFFSAEAEGEVRKTAAREVLRVFDGNPPKNWVNQW